MRKVLLSLLILLVIAIAGGLYWLRGNLDALIAQALRDYGSAMTQSSVSVGSVHLAPTDGKGAIQDLVIGNPKGFKTAHALSVGQIELDVDVGTLTQDVVLIRRIAIMAPEVIYEKGQDLTNFDALQKNIASYLGPSTQKDKPPKKYIVRELRVTNAKAHASAAFLDGKTVSVPLPDIVLRDLGQAKGGLTAGELGQEVVAALKAKLSAALSFDNLMKSTGSALEKVGDTVKGLFK